MKKPKTLIQRGLAKVWRKIQNPLQKAPLLTYRSYQDLSLDIRNSLCIIPRDIDLIVGIPKSGMIPALMLGLYLNTSITDLNSFLDGRIYTHGRTRTPKSPKTCISDCHRILIVDDSVNTGISMTQTRSQIEEVTKGLDVLIYYMAIYSTVQARLSVDYFCRIIPHPRIFEWNLMNSWVLNKSCVDIDGVLCVDPTEKQNDDGEQYVKFLGNATPIFTPQKPINMLVTSRLEKYRPQTEQWLAKHNIVYNKLVMLDLPSKAERIRLQVHGKFKAEVFKKTNNLLFIESSQRQAEEIVKIAKKPVLSFEDQKLLLPR